MNIIDFSKAFYHLENLKSSVERAKNNVNAEDISIEFLYNCMKERIENEKDLKERYESFVSSFFSNKDRYIKIKGERTFYVFKDKNSLLKFLNKNNEDNVQVIESIPVFYTDKKKVLVPENEVNVLRKPYIYLGRFFVFIK